MFIIPFKNIMCTNFLQHSYKYHILCSLNRHFLSDTAREWKCMSKALGRMSSYEAYLASRCLPHTASL